MRMMSDRRSAGLCGLLAAALAAAALLLAPGSSSAEDAPFLDWNPILPAVGGAYHPSREQDCVYGNPECIEHTLSEMYRRFDRRYASCDHNSAFGITYIRVTEGIRGSLRRGLYEEPRFLAHEDRVFARMYFSAFDAWQRGRRQLVAPAWLEAFDAGRQRSVNGVGNLLLSMNAHINRDMPFMLDALGLVMPDGRSRKPDHDRGNRVLQPLYDDVLSELADRYDPTIRNYDVPATLADDVALFQVLQGWREDVWRKAELLGAANTPEERRTAAAYVENYALGMARTIRRSTTIRSSAARDAHCAAYRRSHRERGGQARVRRAPRGARSSRRGVVRVRVVCPEPVRDCAGELALMRRGRRLARPAALRLRAGESAVVRLRLGRSARRALVRRGRLAARARVASPSPWGSTRTSSTRLLLLAPRR